MIAKIDIKNNLRKVLRFKTFAIYSQSRTTKKTNKMENLAINPVFISDNNTFSFKEVPSMYDGFFDVMYKGQRIAILNGISAPLQWTIKNGSEIPVQVVEQLENMVKKLITKTNKSKQRA
jgi:hypothetical protein